MWKKTFIRTALAILVALAGLFVFATTHSASKKTESEECIKTHKECCNKSQGDFLIWESMSRAIVANAQF
jgi:hypothetical protein